MILFSDTDRNIRHGQLHSSGAQLPCCTLLARTLSPFGPRLGEGRMAGSCLLMSKGLYIVVKQSDMGQGQLGEKQDREVQLFRPGLLRNFLLAVPPSSFSAAVALERKSPFPSLVPWSHGHADGSATTKGLPWPKYETEVHPPRHLQPGDSKALLRNMSHALSV